MKAEIYTSKDKLIWDDFVHHSKNGTFLLYRDFIEYHGNRFNDYSFMFYKEDNILGLIAGHIEDNIYYSHKGLTYGGLIMSGETTAKNVLDIFDCLTSTLRLEGIKKIVYKPIPHIYHRLPSEEDLYALFRHKAELIGRNISSTICLPNTRDYSKSRERGLKKAEKAKLRIEQSNDLACFWNILNDNLSDRYNTVPVHSLSEIIYLKNLFPNQIHFYAAYDPSGKLMGGCLVFEANTLIHAQYTAATEEGKDKGAIDLLIDHIITYAPSDKKFFDYGTSTEKQGLFLNEGLIYQKEGFGGRGIVYDIYSIDL